MSLPIRSEGVGHWLIPCVSAALDGLTLVITCTLAVTCRALQFFAARSTNSYHEGIVPEGVISNREGFLTPWAVWVVCSVWMVRPCIAWLADAKRPFRRNGTVTWIRGCTLLGCISLLLVLLSVHVPSLSDVPITHVDQLSKNDGQPTNAVVGPQLYSFRGRMALLFLFVGLASLGVVSAVGESTAAKRTAKRSVHEVVVSVVWIMASRIIAILAGNVTYILIWKAALANPREQSLYDSQGGSFSSTDWQIYHGHFVLVSLIAALRRVILGTAAFSASLYFLTGSSNIQYLLADEDFDNVPPSGTANFESLILFLKNSNALSLKSLVLASVPSRAIQREFRLLPSLYRMVLCIVQRAAAYVPTATVRRAVRNFVEGRRYRLDNNTSPSDTGFSSSFDGSEMPTRIANRRRSSSASDSAYRSLTAFNINDSSDPITQSPPLIEDGITARWTASPQDQRTYMISILSPTLLALIMNLSTLHPDLYTRPVAELGVAGNTHWSILLPYLLPLTVGAGNLLGLALYLLTFNTASNPLKLYYRIVFVNLSIAGVTVASLEFIGRLWSTSMYQSLPFFLWPFVWLASCFWSSATVLLRCCLLSALQGFTVAPALVALHRNCPSNIMTFVLASVKVIFGASACLALCFERILSQAFIASGRFSIHISDQSSFGLFGLKTAELAGALWPLGATLEQTGPMVLSSDAIEYFGSPDFASLRTLTAMILCVFVCAVVAGMSFYATDGRNWFGVCVGLFEAERINVGTGSADDPDLPMTPRDRQGSEKGSWQLFQRPFDCMDLTNSSSNSQSPPIEMLTATYGPRAPSASLPQSPTYGLPSADNWAKWPPDSTGSTAPSLCTPTLQTDSFGQPPPGNSTPPRMDPRSLYVS